MTVLVKKCNPFLVAMANTRPEGEYWVLPPTGAAGPVINPNLLARAIRAEEHPGGPLLHHLQRSRCRVRKNLGLAGGWQPRSGHPGSWG